jgi:crotonobetainyl-CoA:carnitine CoA-transferase CaiB-like acyl-CoA transferase
VRDGERLRRGEQYTCTSARFYINLIDALDLNKHPLFEDLDQWKRECWPEQISVLKQLFASCNRDDWAQRLEPIDACASPVLTYAEAPLHGHAQARGTFQEVEGAYYLNPAPRYSMTTATADWSSSDRDVAAARRDLGIDDQHIDLSLSASPHQGSESQNA